MYIYIYAMFTNPEKALGRFIRCHPEQALRCSPKSAAAGTGSDAPGGGVEAADAAFRRGPQVSGGVRRGSGMR